jgi:hypothetical protein
MYPEPKLKNKEPPTPSCPRELYTFPLTRMLPVRYVFPVAETGTIFEVTVRLDTFAVVMLAEVVFMVRILALAIFAKDVTES